MPVVKICHVSSSYSKKVSGRSCLQGCRIAHLLSVRSSPHPPPHSKRSCSCKIGVLVGRLNGQKEEPTLTSIVCSFPCYPISMGWSPLMSCGLRLQPSFGTQEWFILHMRPTSLRRSMQLALQPQAGWNQLRGTI